MGRACKPRPGSGPRLSLPLGLEKSLPLCRLIEETPRDGHPHCPTEVVGSPVHEENTDHLCCPRVTLCGCHIQVFVGLAVQRSVGFGMESRLGCCTPSFSLCKDFDTLSGGCLGSLWYWIFSLTGGWFGGICREEQKETSRRAGGSCKGKQPMIHLG